MKEVNKDIFYSKIGIHDVVCSVVGNYPYTVHFKTRSGELKGKVVEDYTMGIKNNYPLVSKYYLYL